MLDQDKSKQELIAELAETRRRVAVLETADNDRRQAEQALRESEERYRLLSELVPHPLWRSDAEGRQIDCNRRWQEYTGQTPEEAQGDGWMKALHPDDVAWAMQRKREDVAGGEIYQAEYRLHRASDDTYHWHLARAIPWRDAHGTILGWFGSAMDIEAQKQAQAALAEREARLLEAQEVASLGFYFWDIAADRWTSSPVLDRILGIPADYERTLAGWANLVHPDERREMLDHMLEEVVGEKKPCDRQYRIVRHEDKQVRWVHGLGRLQFNADGQPVSLLGTIQDITERKLAEEALRESEERFKLFMDNSPAIAWMKDEEGRYVYVNASCARRVGFGPEERIGKTDFEIWPLPTAEQFRKNDQEVLASGHLVEVVEESTMPDGKRSYCRNFKFPFQDSAGRRFVGGVGIDITERKLAEEALQAAHDELEQRVKERTAELAKEYRNVKHLLHASDNERQLIAYEIHDGLAQQLAGALMQLQAFDHLKDKSPKKAAKAFDAAMTMLRQGHFETRRLIAGVRPPILDESGIVEAVAHLIHEVSRERGPKIDWHTGVDFDRLDPTLENAIYRIAQEALTNACKHSRSKRIWVSLSQRGDRLRIEVRDWGVGFDPKTVPKNHFGLEGIRQRARLLGGKCSIRSAAGKGARVIVELPVVPRDEEQ